MQSIVIEQGRIFIEGKHTTNPELIGLAMLDFAETIDNDGLSITLKDQDIFIENIEKQ
jgi:hypothetical protein